VRRGLGREGAFVGAGRLFAEHFGGPEPGRDAFMWGLPERAAWRLGHKYLGYDTVCNPKWLVLAAGRSAAARQDAPGASTSLDVVELQHFPPALDGLFERAAAAHGALALRDARRLAWRFGGDERVRIAIARGRADAGPGAAATGAAGYVVARPGVIDGHRGLIVCDWLVARGAPGSAARAGAALQSWIRRATLRLGLECAVCALPETSREWLEFQRAGWRVRPSRFRLVARCYRPELSVDWLRRHWYWTLADTDLV